MAGRHAVAGRQIRLPADAKHLAGTVLSYWTHAVSILALLLVSCAASADDTGRTGSDHWAFRPITRPPIPRVEQHSWVRNPIDAFILAEHEKRGLGPSTEASPARLLRRVYLDLIGLPPTREELHAFLANPSDQAYEELVDRLLASPRYGERWARHWMDIWRYSDWYGRRHVPDVWNSAPQVWRWRDWIIDSLNSDKGYDRMVLEMLAADEIAPGDEKAAVATGYLVRNWYALNPHQWRRDIVEHTGKALLGLTFNCAHCHDHKYDPISQEDYFRLRAFFEPIEPRQDRWPGEPDPGPFQPYEYSTLRKVVNIGSVSVFDKDLNAETYMYRGGDERNRIEEGGPVEAGVPEFLTAAPFAIEPLQLPPKAWYPGLKSFVQQAELDERYAAVQQAHEHALARMNELKEGESSARAQVEQFERDLQAAMKLAEANLQRAKRHLEALQLGPRAAKAELDASYAELESLRARMAADRARYLDASADSDALIRDAVQAERRATMARAHAELATAQYHLASAEGLAADDEQRASGIQKAQQQISDAQKKVAAAEQLSNEPATDYQPLSPQYPRESSGRRRALAEWIAHRDNPLTARVAVNHVWARHFGQAIVASVFDFGRNGTPPTHPELLDWLAAELMASGWRMKHVHRLIVLSSTYRQTSAHQALDAAADNPSDPQSLDVDNRYLWHFPSWRMQAEAVRDSILHLSGQLDTALGGPSLDNVADAQVTRRSLYFSIYPEDGGHLRFLALFDPPNPSDCYRRTETVVPQQSLALTNSPMVLTNSRILARQLAQQTSQDLQAGQENSFVVAAFEHILTRSPSSQELDACRQFLLRQAELIRGAASEPVMVEGNVPPAADPAQRARESLVRALLNHNDFITVR